MRFLLSERSPGEAMALRIVLFVSIFEFLMLSEALAVTMSTNTANVRPGLSGGCNMPSQSETKPDQPASATASGSIVPTIFSLGSCSASATARANAGNVGVQAMYTSRTSQSGRVTAGAATQLATFDFISENPTATPLDSFPTALNLDLSYSISTSSDTPLERLSFATIDVKASVAGATNSFGGSVLADYQVAHFSDGTISTLGAFVPPTADELNIGKLPLIIPASLPSITLTLSLGATAGVSSGFELGSSTTSNVSALNSLSLAKSGPVFDLPEGWSVNSRDGVVKNNLFFGFGSLNSPDGDATGGNDDGNGSIPPTPVPAPIPLVLLAFSLATMFLVKSRMRRTCPD